MSLYGIALAYQLKKDLPTVEHILIIYEHVYSRFMSKSATQIK
ncbi:hypothetical protein [Nostoc sp. FACHB-133]|nr:hypothetical protein [Nostoc sp. FACHB-133]